MPPSAITYIAELESESPAGILDKLKGRLLHDKQKVKQDALYSKDPVVKAEAEELLKKYDAYENNDREYRVKAQKARRIRKIAVKVTDKEKQEKYWDRYNKLKEEMAECYVEPVDINRLACDMLEHNAVEDREAKEREYNDGLKAKNQKLAGIKKRLDRKHEEKLKNIDMWSSENIKTWLVTRAGAFGGTYVISEKVLSGLEETEVWGYKLKDIKDLAVGIAFAALPILDYYLSKKRSSLLDKYDSDVEKLEKKAKEDIGVTATKLAEDKGKITEAEYITMRDVYKICFGTLEGFPENPVKLYEQEMGATSENNIPLEVVEAPSAKEIKRSAEKLRKRAEEML